MQFEKEQLARIAAGDQVALKALYDLYYPRLARFLLRMHGDPETVIELINDVFWVVWTKAHDFRGEASVSTWILSIAYRKAARSLARRRPGHAPSERALEERLLQHGHDGHAERVGDARDLERVLARLSPEQRAVVELTYYFGYSYGEIAAILDCPANTVKTRMYHARRSLRRLLEAAPDG